MQIVYSTLASIAVAVLSFVLQSVIKENRELKKKKEQEQQAKELEQQAKETAIENGLLCLLRVKLIEYHSKYMELGEISTHGYENWMLMYRAYKALGGNGMIEHMKDEIEDLHIRVGK